jgi:hypothetical protein
MRDIIEATYYRGSRSDPEHTKRPSLSFTDDPDVASVYAADPKSKAYVTGSRVTRADFDLQNPVDLSGSDMISLEDALYAAGIADATEHVQETRNLIYALYLMNDRDVPFHFRFPPGMNIDFWEELRTSVRRAVAREDWETFSHILQHTEVDVYAIADTKAYTKIAQATGHDGIIYHDSSTGASKMAPDLIGKSINAKHLTYRPFGPVKWGI